MALVLTEVSEQIGTVILNNQEKRRPVFKGE
jgi:hypothetical protein